jgi:hypothetical protein
MALGFYKEKGTAIGLPHSPISLSVFLVVESGICAAWELMRNNPRIGFNLLNATEDVVTHELYERLYDEVFHKGLVEGFDRELLADITRESKVRNYDKTKLDKMPDLLFRLVDRPRVEYPSQDWLFIECKPVDSDHAVGAHYCDKGIVRFIKGEYAWTMSNALMIGYSRSSYTILPKLTDALKARPKEIPTLDYPRPCSRSKTDLVSEVVHISRHERTFEYVETEKAAPAITIRHLWLKRD